MGRVLTPEAEGERAQFHASGYPNCSCHISPPCGSCTHPGNPLNQDEDDSCWVDEEEEHPGQEVSRQSMERAHGVIGS